MNLSDGSQLEITVGKYRMPNGRVIDQVGITPDLLVTDANALTKSVQVLGGLATLDNNSNSKK